MSERTLQTHEFRQHNAAIVPMQARYASKMDSGPYRENPEMGSGPYRENPEMRSGPSRENPEMGSGPSREITDIMTSSGSAK